MTNLDIITTAMQLHEVDEEVDTYAGWQRNGYQVKRGEHALFKTKIWRPVKNKKTEEKESDDKQKLILVNAAFFGESQVEAIK